MIYLILITKNGINRTTVQSLDQAQKLINHESVIGFRCVAKSGRSNRKKVEEL